MQMQFDQLGLGAIAAAYVDANGTVEFQRNCTVVRTGPGTYDLTLPAERSVGEKEGIITATLRGQNVACGIKVLDLSPTLKRVITTDMGCNPTDSDFNIKIERFAALLP